MKNLSIIFLIIIFNSSSACSQEDKHEKENEKNEIDFQLVGGPCEGCEAIFEYGSMELYPTDTLPDFYDEGTKIKLTGTIYENDGKTPARGVILYIYHTDQSGIYPTKGSETGWARRHGYIRGWIKTGNDGKYTFYTLKPGAYPSRDTPVAGVLPSFS